MAAEVFVDDFEVGCEAEGLGVDWDLRFAPRTVVVRAR